MSNIAIIGTGISGLGAAYLLHAHHNVTVYEKAAVVGGHTRTRDIRYGTHDLAVDTGFIVFNYRNYPHLTALFRHLGVAVQKSNMSFAVSADEGALEWSAESPNALFGQRENLWRPAFWRFLLDVVRFNLGAVKLAARHPDWTLGDLVNHMKLGDWFTRYYILPMGGAIWSCPLSAILQFPAKAFVDFFEAHGLLTITRQPQWYTVTGGSKEYLKRLIAPFQQNIRASCPALRVTRKDGEVEISDGRGETLTYDQVIFACHADEALAMLTDPTPEEKSLLGAFQYQKNVAVLHKSTAVMPKRRACWASWVYHADSQVITNDIAVTYWMNQLQALPEECPVFVTLNPLKEIPLQDVFDRHEFTHPIYSSSAIVAQKRLPSIQGKRNSWFCGAYLRNGFHEDGLASAIAVAMQLGVEVPWN